MKVRIHASFLLYFLLVGVFSSWSTCFSSLFALLVHELGHYFVSRMMGEEIASIELTPFGGVIHRRHNSSSLKGLRGTAIALAGPLSNYVWIYLLSFPPIFRLIKVNVFKKLAISNLVMMGMNLLPVLPLDGGQAAFCIGYYFFRADRLIAFLTGMGQFVGGLLITVAVYGFLKAETLNCSMIIIGIYLIKHARSQKKNLRSENLYIILREQLNQQTKEMKRVSFFSVSPDTPLYAALPAINCHSASVFLIQNKDKFQIVGEKKLCYEMLHDPNLLFEQIAIPLSK